MKILLNKKLKSHTSFSRLFRIPRTKSVRFLSKIRSRLPFTLTSAILKRSGNEATFPSNFRDNRVLKRQSTDQKIQTPRIFFASEIALIVS